MRVDNLWVESRALTGLADLAWACIPRENRTVSGVPDRHTPKALFLSNLR
jgi:hypothetical protein